MMGALCPLYACNDYERSVRRRMGKTQLAHHVLTDGCLLCNGPKAHKGQSCQAFGLVMGINAALKHGDPGNDGES